MTASPWQHFTAEELACRHCGEMKMNDRFMRLIERIRIEFGIPMPVSSGYRCPEYNARISSTGRDGPHTTGCAIDVAIARYHARALMRVALEHGIEGLGVKQHGTGRFLHLDAYTGLQPRPTVWSY